MKSREGYSRIMSMQDDEFDEELWRSFFPDEVDSQQVIDNNNDEETSISPADTI